MEPNTAPAIHAPATYRDKQGLTKGYPELFGSIGPYAEAEQALETQEPLPGSFQNAGGPNMTPQSCKALI